MGLKKRSTNVVYLNLKEGKIYESTDKDKQNPFDEVEGHLTNISFKDDEYNGQKLRKAMVTINDGETDYILSMKTDSSYFSSMVGFLKNTDLTRVLALVPTYKEEKDGRIRIGLLVRQEGKYAKAYYTKDTPNGLPAFKQVQYNGKTLWDKTDYLAFLENVVTTEIKPHLVVADSGAADAPQTGLKTSGPAYAESATPIVHNGEEVVDDLPF